MTTIRNRIIYNIWSLYKKKATQDGECAARVDKSCGRNIGLSSDMGFLNENDSSAYFEVLGELSSGLSLTVGFFKTFGFPSSLVGFFRGPGRTYLGATP